MQLILPKYTGHGYGVFNGKTCLTGFISRVKAVEFVREYFGEVVEEIKGDYEEWNGVCYKDKKF